VDPDSFTRYHDDALPIFLASRVKRTAPASSDLSPLLRALSCMGNIERRAYNDSGSHGRLVLHGVLGSVGVSFLHPRISRLSKSVLAALWIVLVCYYRLCKETCTNPKLGQSDLQRLPQRPLEHSKDSNSNLDFPLACSSSLKSRGVVVRAIVVGAVAGFCWLLRCPPYRAKCKIVSTQTHWPLELF
jgi:hypothetical protein